jgi:hypothetical protein
MLLEKSLMFYVTVMHQTEINGIYSLKWHDTLKMSNKKNHKFDIFSVNWKNLTEPITRERGVQSKVNALYCLHLQGSPRTVGNHCVSSGCHRSQNFNLHFKKSLENRKSHPFKYFSNLHKK